MAIKEIFESTNSETPYSVYKITNEANGMIYVGQTCNFEQRTRQHKSREDNPHLRNAMKKYGIENFTFEVLYSDLTKEEADKMEIKLISDWELTNRSKGYNLRSGGSRGKHSKETIEKMCKAQKGRKLSPKALEGIRKGAEKRRGIKQSRRTVNKRMASVRRHYEQCVSPLKGIAISDKHRQHICESVKRGAESHLWNKGKAVAQIDKETNVVIKIYPTAREAHRQTGIAPYSISRTCREDAHRKTAGGYKWKFVDDSDIYEGMVI